MKTDFQIGQRVKYAPAFLKSIAARDWKTRRGVIAEIGDPVRPGVYYLRVQWAGDPAPAGVLSCNLASA